MVGDVVEDVAGPAAVDQASALPGGALKDRGAAGAGAGEDHVPDVQAGRAAVVDLRERAVGKVAPARGRTPGGQRPWQVDGVPRDAHAALRICGQVAVVVVGEPQQLLFGLAMVQ